MQNEDWSSLSRIQESMKRLAPQIEYAVDFEDTGSARLRVIEFSIPGNTHEQALFIAGWASTPYTWRHFIPRLCAYGKILYVETREKPSSSLKAPATFEVRELAKDVASIASSRFQGSSYGLVGASTGANSVIECWPYLDIHPKWVSLVLPHEKVPIPWYVLLLNFFPGVTLSGVQRLLIASLKRGRGPRRLADQKDGLIAALDTADFRKLRDSASVWWRYQLQLERVKKISVPTLVIGASDDHVHDISSARAVFENVADGHWYDARSFAGAHSSRTADFLAQWAKSISVEQL